MVSRTVAAPSTTGGINAESVITQNAPIHIHVMRDVTHRKPSLAAVAASTDELAYSRTNGLPSSAPASATTNSPRLDSGCSHRSRTPSSRASAATNSTANTATVPTSSDRHGRWRRRATTCPATDTPNATATAATNPVLPTRIQ